MSTDLDVQISKSVMDLAYCSGKMLAGLPEQASPTPLLTCTPLISLIIFGYPSVPPGITRFRKNSDNFNKLILDDSLEIRGKKSMLMI